MSSSPSGSISGGRSSSVTIGSEIVFSACGTFAGGSPELPLVDPEAIRGVVEPFFDPEDILDIIVPFVEPEVLPAVCLFLLKTNNSPCANVPEVAN